MVNEIYLISDKEIKRDNLIKPEERMHDRCMLLHHARECLFNNVVASSFFIIISSSLQIILNECEFDKLHHRWKPLT